MSLSDSLNPPMRNMGGVAGNAANAIERKLHVHETMEYAFKAVEELNTRVEILQNRLRPIMATPDGDEAVGESNQPRPRTELGGKINNLTDSIQSAAAKINEMLVNLEI